MIDIEQLVVRHGAQTVLDRVGFQAAPGRHRLPRPQRRRQVVHPAHPGGLDRADGGHALIAGRCYLELAAPLRTVGSMLDGSGAHRSRTARTHLAWVARSNGIGSGHRIAEVLDRVGLTDHSSPGR